MGEIDGKGTAVGRQKGWQELEMALPEEGLSAPTLHLPISLQFKESLHLSASVRDRFAAKEGWAVLRILAWLGVRPRKEWEGQGQLLCPKVAGGPQAQARPP